MRLVELFTDNPLVWGLFALYLVGTSYLAWLGHKKTDDIESFAVGKGDMSPVVVGITLAASIASAATFVLNPGLVYRFGYSALMHLGVAAAGGVIIGLFTLSFGFRRVGQRVSAITLPQWVAERYGSRGLAPLFAAVNLLSVAFMVLIVAGLAIVMRLTLGLTNDESVILIIGFVFSYIFLGGTYAHAYTNTLQGIVMTVIATIIVASGLHLFGDGVGAFFDRVAAQDPNLVLAVSPGSPLYGSFFSVWISGFIIGFALVCQPHILTKALYVKSDKAVLQYLLVATVVSIVFTALLFVGMYARAGDIPQELFLGPGGIPKADEVMTVYVNETFGPALRAVIAVALLAAGMSTLDGILVALSSITANDLFLNLTERNVLAKHTPEERSRIAHRASQIILVLLGAVTLWISRDPPELISLFGQYGVFALVAASAGPVVFGVFARHIPAFAVYLSTFASLAVYWVMYFWVKGALADGQNLNEVVMGWGPAAMLFDTGHFQLGLLNPAVLAAYAIAVSFLILGAFALLGRDPADARAGSTAGGHPGRTSLAKSNDGSEESAA